MIVEVGLGEGGRNSDLDVIVKFGVLFLDGYVLFIFRGFGIVCGIIYSLLLIGLF